MSVWNPNTTNPAGVYSKYPYLHMHYLSFKQALNLIALSHTQMVFFPVFDVLQRVVLVWGGHISQERELLENISDASESSVLSRFLRAHWRKAGREDGMRRPFLALLLMLLMFLIIPRFCLEPFKDKHTQARAPEEQSWERIMHGWCKQFWQG